MTKEKQIEQIGMLIEDILHLEEFQDGYFKSDVKVVAEKAYNIGFRKQSEWISVEERLPERNGRYLTHCNIEGQSLVCILHYCKVGGFNEGTVTHWMPLPEAPKMKGGAE